MNEPNPYRPPLAGVDDVRTEAPHAPGTVTVWSARGRIGRLRYLAYNTAAALLLGVVTSLAGPMRGAAVVVALGAIPVLVLSALTAIQRAHDMDWPAWTAAMLLIPFVPLVWTFKAGTPGTNRYGPPPPPNSTAVKVLGLWLPLLGVVLGLASIVFVASVVGGLKGWR